MSVRVFYMVGGVWLGIGWFGGVLGVSLYIG